MSDANGDGNTDMDYPERFDVARRVAEELLGDWQPGEEPFTVPVGDFAGVTLPFNDPLLPLMGSIVGVQMTKAAIAAASFINNLTDDVPGTPPPPFYPVPEGAPAITGGAHINLIPVWDEFTGKGVNIKSVEGLDYRHPDLQENFTRIATVSDARDRGGAAGAGDHGTSVASLIAAEGNNGIGMVGVAPDASFFGISTVIDDFGPFDVIQSSLSGPDIPSMQTPRFNQPDMFARRIRAAETGRDDLGAIWVNSAGNGGNLQTSLMTEPIFNQFEILPVAWAGETGDIDGASNFGTQIHVSAVVSGLINTALPSLRPIDRETFDGFWDMPRILGFDVDALGLAGSGTSAFTGTSAAAPLVSGGVALMLEAAETNQFGVDLGWRDVQEILAISARHAGPGLTEDVSGHRRLHPWEINGAAQVNGQGLHFSKDHGFGLLDIHGAVRLAQTWHQTRTSHNLIESRSAVLANDDVHTVDYGAPLTFEVEVGDNLELDVVTLKTNFAHEQFGDFRITITSPDGTVSRVMDTVGTFSEPQIQAQKADGTVTDYLTPQEELEDNAASSNRSLDHPSFSGSREGWPMLSRAFWGEDSAGTWTITVEDVIDNGKSGSVSGMELIFEGDAASNDDVYFFTDDWANMNEAAGAVPVIDDTTGTDSLNMAAISGDIALDLTAGASVMAGHYGNDATGQVFTLDGTRFATATTGDGHDTVTGTDAGDHIFTREGRDSLHGGAGDDTLDSGVDRDQIWAGPGHDRVMAGAGADRVFTGRGADTVHGGDSFDLIFGGPGRDRLFGERGIDRLEGGPGADTLDGGNARDFALYTRSDAGVRVDLATGAVSGGHGDGDVLRSIEGVIGSMHDDSISGTGLSNDLRGFGGDDRLFGLGGHDTLTGGGGADTLVGGSGDNILTGDAPLARPGADLFLFAADDTGATTITDFNADMDRLDLSAFDLDRAALRDLARTVGDEAGDSLELALTDGLTLTLSGQSTALLDSDAILI
ncbi:S8 family serine peptidase [Yunchengibacter salinarum]|uniref:S8 family serine peptidase n=1 Tax=Yunchengibacter salinarum TaxID=3133399 RepID=UPI0035B6218D